MAKLVLLFILVPALELVLLIEVGRRIGGLATAALIVSTGILGAFLARRQGLHVLVQIRGELSQGRLPASALMDGLIILVAAAFLLTPGLLTDALGFLLLVPALRNRLKKEGWRRIQKAQEEGRAFVFTTRPGWAGSDPIDVTPEPTSPERGQPRELADRSGRKTP